MDGSEKLSPLAIGKFRKPRCFKNVKSLPFFYDANKKSWMTADLWEKTIQRLDKEFSKQKRNVVFIADNCTAHCSIPDLKSIELVFLPPNVTSVLQPLDQGVIQNLKVNYRKLLMKDLISAIDKKTDFHISMLDAMFYIDKSWNMVSKTCISNCFRHAGFVNATDNANDQTRNDDEEDDDVPLSQLAQDLRFRGCNIHDENEYIAIDSELATTSEASISEIVSQTLDTNAVGSDDDDDSESENETVTKAEALTALNVVRKFFSNSEAAEEHFKTVKNLEAVVMKMKPAVHQTCITDYFKC